MRKKHPCSRLRHRLTLQQEVRTPDTAGGYARSWEEVADLWAEITPLAASSERMGREILVAGQLQAEVTHRILMRYREGVTPAMRLCFDERIFTIRSVVNTQERNETLELLVQEGAAG